MADQAILAEQFERNRKHLRAVAYRMLGSASEAEDAVQEAWLRLSGSAASEIENLRGWMTTTTARICLDLLRSRKRRAEQPIGPEVEAIAAGDDVEREAQIADSVGVAMLVVLEALAPAERVAFVLHDMFNVAFEDIAKVVGRSPAAARQMASRARRRVQGQSIAPGADHARQREVIEAFLAAARGDDFSALLALLDPEVLLRADAAAVAMSLARPGAPVLAAETSGAKAVAGIFSGRAKAAQSVLIDGIPGLMFAPRGKPLVVFDFVIEEGRIVEISLIADQQNIAALELGA